jgi:hypothetical protein
VQKATKSSAATKLSTGYKTFYRRNIEFRMTISPIPMPKHQLQYTDTSCSTDSKSPEKSPLVATASMMKVRFNAHIDVREVPRLKDLPEGEVGVTWYTPVEFDRIKESLITTVRLMMAKKPIGNDYCVRGLEFRTPAGAKMRKQNKLKSLTAVWNEQVAQWKKDRTDEEAICFVYQQENHECRTVALRLGLQDEKEARRYLDEDCSDEADFSTIPLEENINNTLEEPHRSTVVPTAA